MSIEHEFIDWVKPICDSNTQIALGIGDDAAIVQHGDQYTVISTDLLADGVHFKLNETPNHLIGRKALAVNLSDMAAMAAVPVSAVVGLLLPRTMELDQAKDIFLGLKSLADQYNVSIVGGDTNAHDGPLVINCTITGTIALQRDIKRTWNMSAAQPGDVILVSGDFGNSIAGKHLTFQPRIDLALYLSQKYDIKSATDITDSLTIDLAAIARQSNCGVRLNLEDIPLSPLAKARSIEPSDGEYFSKIQLATDRSGARACLDPGSLTLSAAQSSALFDGEDFELAVCVANDIAQAILTDTDCPVTMKKIGVMTPDRGLVLIDAQGRSAKIKPSGYVH